MTSKEIKTLKQKIARYVASKIKFLQETELTYKEISEKAGVGQNRLSELVVHGYLPYSTLIGLIGAGFIKIEELLEKVELLSQEEIDYIKELAEEDESNGDG